MSFMDLGLFFALVAFSIGASIGSFVNVVVYRLPAGMSLVRPSSRCPGCETPIKPWHNIPVLGWLMIRGKCASCNVPVSVRYPTVELILGLIAVALLHEFAGGWVDREVLIQEDFLMAVVAPTLLYLVLVADLMAIALIDLDHFAVYNVTTYPLIPVGLLCAFAFGDAIDVTWQDALIGAISGGGVLITITVLYPLIRGREGMGWGDWHVLALIGAWLGWEGLPFILWAASVQGILFAVAPGLGFGVEELPPMPSDGTEMESGDTGQDLPSEIDSETAGEESSGFLLRSVPFATVMVLGAIEYLLFREEIRSFLANHMSFGP